MHTSNALQRTTVKRLQSLCDDEWRCILCFLPAWEAKVAMLACKAARRAAQLLFKWSLTVRECDLRSMPVISRDIHALHLIVEDGSDWASYKHKIPLHNIRVFTMVMTAYDPPECSANECNEKVFNDVTAGALLESIVVEPDDHALPFPLRLTERTRNVKFLNAHAEVIVVAAQPQLTHIRCSSLHVLGKDESVLLPTVQIIDVDPNLQTNILDDIYAPPAPPALNMFMATLEPQRLTTLVFTLTESHFLALSQCKNLVHLGINGLCTDTMFAIASSGLDTSSTVVLPQLKRLDIYDSSCPLLVLHSGVEHIAIDNTISGQELIPMRVAAFETRSIRSCKVKMSAFMQYPQLPITELWVACSTEQSVQGLCSYMMNSTVQSLELTLCQSNRALVRVASRTLVSLTVRNGFHPDEMDPNATVFIENCPKLLLCQVHEVNVVFGPNSCESLHTLILKSARGLLPLIEEESSAASKFWLDSIPELVRLEACGIHGSQLLITNCRRLSDVYDPQLVCRMDDTQCFTFQREVSKWKRIRNQLEQRESQHLQAANTTATS